MDTKRTSIRLTPTDLGKLDEYARLRRQTRSKAIIGLLQLLQRKIFFDRIEPFDLATLERNTKPDGGTKINVRLPTYVTDYYDLNCYKITSALIYAINKIAAEAIRDWAKMSRNT